MAHTPPLMSSLAHSVITLMSLVRTSDISEWNTLSMGLGLGAVVRAQRMKPAGFDVLLYMSVNLVMCYVMSCDVMYLIM